MGIIFIILTSILFLLSMLSYIYFYYTGLIVSFVKDPDYIDKLGSIGDFFGGVVNPFLGFFSFMALLITIYLQLKELRLTREELSLVKEAAENQAKALKEQLEHAVKQGKKLDENRIEERKFVKTNIFIDQYFSNEFIFHRIAVSKMREKVLQNRVSVKYISNGFLYPNYLASYDGLITHDLTEHQHLTIYLGFIERLGNAIKNGELNEGALKNALSYEFRWHADLIRNIAICTKELAIERNVKCPTFVDHTEKVISILNIDIDDDQINRLYFEYTAYENRLIHESKLR